LFLNEGADVATQGFRRWRALQCAANRGHKDVVELLLSKSVDVAAQDISGWAAMHKAASQGHKNVIALLLDKVADITTMYVFINVKIPHNILYLIFFHLTYHVPHFSS
jgi:ankyrin repeat protein